MMCSGYDPRAVVLEQVPDFKALTLLHSHFHVATVKTPLPSVKFNAVARGNCSR